jgi:succinate-semialdehyde dehydrogenase/glutarate-semialdehyde dehydrogenase
MYTDLELVVAGKQIAAAAREGEDVLNPVTGEATGYLPHAKAADLDRVFEAAEMGFKAWKGTLAVEMPRSCGSATSVSLPQAPFGGVNSGRRIRSRH